MFQFPVNPTTGQQVVAPNGFTYQFNGVKWFTIGGGGGGSNVFVGDTPPASPAIGDMWFNSTNLKLFVWYEGAWVVANPSGGGGSGGAGVTVSETAPANPSIGALWWDSSIGRLFVWDGGTGNEWVSVPWGSGVSQNDLTAALAGYLPLTGGTTTGAIYAPGLVAGAVVSRESVSWNAITGAVAGQWYYVEDNKIAATMNVAPGGADLVLRLAGPGAADWPITWAGQINITPSGGISTNGGLSTQGVIDTNAGFSYAGQDPFSFSWNGYSTTFMVSGTLQGYWPTSDGTIGYMGIAAGGGPVGIALNVLNSNRTTALYFYADAASDERIKKNIEDTDVDGLAAILATPVRQFDIKGEAVHALRPLPPPNAPVERPQPIADQHVPIGIVAQEVQALMPEMVTVSQQPEGHDPAIPRDLMSVSNAAAVPYLIRAVQQLAARVAELEAQR